MKAPQFPYGLRKNLPVQSANNQASFSGGPEMKEDALGTQNYPSVVKENMP